MNTIQTRLPGRKQYRRPALSTVCAALALLASLGAVSIDSANAQSVSVGLYTPYDIGSVISVYVDAPLVQPEPIAVGWAPPPMLVEEVPPPPDPDAIWTGGYWTWQGQWVWCAGRWSLPPRPEYVWVQPYYEHRYDTVVFIPGYWSAPDVEFIAPSISVRLPLAFVAFGIVAGPAPMGPQGIFIPPPPGSRPGIIIPAPFGTPPAVVISAPPVINVGMRVRGNVEVNSHNTTVNDNRVTYNVTNVRSVTNVTNVTIEAPETATATGHAFQSSVPARAHLAAAMTPVVQAKAPPPVSKAPVPAYVPGHTPVALPAPQHVRTVVNPEAPPRAAAAPAQQPGSTTVDGRKPAPAVTAKPESPVPPHAQAAPLTHPANAPAAQPVPPVTRGEEHPQRARPPAAHDDASQPPQRPAQPVAEDRHPAGAVAVRPEQGGTARPAPVAESLRQPPAHPPAQAARPVEARPNQTADDRAKKAAEEKARREKEHPENGSGDSERR
jgi:hypothetical protein